MSSIFLSYARSDDESFVARLRDDLAAFGIDVWWDRVSMESRGRTFHQEILDGIDRCQRLVLVVGPHAATSAYVRQEWEHALQADTIVTPILRRGDFSLIPEPFKLLHCEDFRSDDRYGIALKNLARQLIAFPPPLGKLIAVPSLPPHYLERRERLLELRDAVRAHLDSPVTVAGTASRLGLGGMAGIGKSVLATALVRDRKVREAFPDGIYWVSLGTKPDVAEKLRELDRLLGGDGSFLTAQDGKVAVAERLRSMQALLVLDDVWRRQDVDAFEVLGPRCKALVTSRDSGLLTSLGGVHYLVELLTDAQALHLLSTVSREPFEALPVEAREIVAECKRLPLALALCGSLIRHGRTWAEVLQELRQARIDRISDRHATEAQHQSVWHAIHLSVEALDAFQRELFLQLAVFPDDDAVPAAAVSTLWSYETEMDDWSCTELLLSLSERSLAEVSAITENGVLRRSVRLHDLVSDYIRHESKADALHDRVLSAYATQCPSGWATGPDDGYFFTNLARHLVAAGRSEELVSLVQDLGWLETKVVRGLAFHLPSDLAIAQESLSATHPQRRILTLLVEALRRDIYFIARHASDYPQGLFQSIWNSGWWYDAPQNTAHYARPEAGVPLGTTSATTAPKLYDLLERWHEDRLRRDPGFIWVRAKRPPATELGRAQLAVFEGHKAGAYAVVISSDGSRFFSGSLDKSIRVWDVESGAEIRCMLGHDDTVRRLALSPDGLHLASAADDRTIRLWELHSGCEVACLHGHADDVHGLAFSADGRSLVSGSADNTVRIWDMESKRERKCLRGHSHTVECVGFTKDSRTVISGSWDQTLRLWDVETGAETRRLHHPNEIVRCLSLSPDGLRVVSGAADGSIRIWDLTSGRSVMRLGHFAAPDEPQKVGKHGLVRGNPYMSTRAWNRDDASELEGHDAIVSSVEYSRDGRRILSASWDRTIRIWDSASGRQLRCLRGHDDKVYCATYSCDGHHLVSGSADKTLRMWEVDVAYPHRFLEGHDANICSVGFSPDRRIVYTASWDGSIRLWDAASAEPRKCLRGHEKPITMAAMSPSGHTIASAGQDESVRIWDVNSGDERLCLRDFAKQVSTLQFSPDGEKIICRMIDNSFRIRNVRTGGDELAFLQDVEGIWSLRFTSDCRFIVSGSVKGDVQMWDVATGVSLRAFRGHGNTIYSLAVDRNERRLATASGDRTVRVWDLESGDELLCLHGHHSHVQRVAFSFDDRCIVSSSEYGRSVRAWDAISGAELSELHGSGYTVFDAAVMRPLSAVRAIPAEFESRFERAGSGGPVAWYPHNLNHWVLHPVQEAWAGADRAPEHLQLLTLEGADVGVTALP